MNVTLSNETTQAAGFHIPFVREMAEITQHMWKNGWDERNGGNVSYLLEEEEVAQYIDIHHVIRKIKPAFSVHELAGKYFIVTASGKYFKNVLADPEQSRIAACIAGWTGAGSALGIEVGSESNK